MTSRFVSNMIVLLSGAFLTAITLAFSPSVDGWLALAVGSLASITILVAFALRGRGVAQRTLDGFTLVTAAWTVVASRCFAGSDLRWLTFANGALLAVLALAGLIVHEVLMELALKPRAGQVANGRLSTGSHERPSVGAL